METTQNKSTALCDLREVLLTLRILYKKGDVVELRMPKTKKKTVSGYYDNTRELLKAVKKYSGHVPSVYVTLNPVKSALLARASNRVEEYVDTTTADSDIVKRRWLPIDVDYDRPKGISTTDEEHARALGTTKEIKAFLKEQGWPDGVFADSGNGGHLLDCIDLPNDDSSKVLIERCLKALDYMFSNERVKVDTGNFNAARIWKLYGTMACKGDNVPERPHRMARILETPDKLEIVSRELLEQLAGMCPEDPEPEYKRHDGYSAFDLDEWMERHSLSVKRTKPWQGGMVYELTECPFNPEHNKGEACIIKSSSGAIGFKCKHNSCQGMGWHTLRDRLEPGWRDKRANAGRGNGAHVGDPQEGYHGMTDKEIIPQVVFPFDVFTPELRGFIERVGEALQVEPEVVAGIALCFLSGCIGNTIRVSPKYGHEVPLFLWLIIVARSGYGKSPAFNALIKPVQNLQALKHTAYKEALKEYKRLIRMAKQDPSIDLPEEPQIEHLYFSDTTVEALSRGFESTHRGVISYQDELAGMILGLNQYKASGRGNDLQHYLELFDCIPWKIDRRGETRVILNTGASITGGIQPQVMPRVFSDDCFDNGLIPRFLFIKADNKPQKYSRKGIEEKDVLFWNNLIKLCYQIPITLNDAGIVEPKVLILSEEAQATWEAFYNEYAEIIPFLSERAQVFIPKLMTYGLKLMGILHILQLLTKKVGGLTLVNVVNVVLSKKICENAIELTRFFIGQAINILDLYKPKEPQLTEYEVRLVRALYALKDSVIRGRLPLPTIVETFNNSLPDTLRLTSEMISSLLRRSLGLSIKPGHAGMRYLIWEEKKITKLFSRINLNNVHQHSPNSSDNAGEASNNPKSEHSEACDCAKCAPAQEEEEGEFIRYRGDS